MQAPLAVQQPAETAVDPDNVAWITSDEFRMYHFKISLCSKRFNHDWNFCPYAHTGERACRRDPLRYNYTSITCLDMLQKGKCPRGDACQAAHSVFEFWLHPHRYRTEMCKVGAGCNRRICFFAHKPEELRPLPEHLANEEGPAGGKYSLSAALPGGASSSTGKDGDQPANPSQQQQQQRQRLHGANSSSSSSTSIVNLSSSLLAASCNAGGSSNTHSPSAPTSWLLPSSGPDNAQAAAAAAAAAMLGAGGFDSLALAAASMPQAASSSSPHALYSSLAGQLPPRMPQVGSTSPWQQQQQQLNAVTLQGQTQLLLLPQQQQSPQQQQQQQQGLAVSNGLSLQLQQLSLAGQPSLNSAAAAAAAAAAQVTAGLACGMQGQVFASGPWQQQQQQHQMLQYGMSLQQQQLLPAAPAATVSCALPAVAAQDAMGLAAFDAHHQQQQQQLLLQGQFQAAQACVPAMLASVTAAPQALCGVGLQQPQHINFMHGQVLQ